MFSIICVQHSIWHEKLLKIIFFKLNRLSRTNFQEDDDEHELLDFHHEPNQSYNHLPEDDLPVIDQPNLIGIRCAAHDIQLSVYDVFKRRTVSNFLAKVRKLVKKLRSQPYVN